MQFDIEDIDGMDDEQLAAAMTQAGGSDAPEEVSTEPETEQADQEQGDTGEQPGSAAPETEQEQQQEQPQTQQEQAPKQVPLSELLSERRKRQEAETRLAEKERAEQEAARQVQAQEQAASLEETITRIYLEEGPEAVAAYTQKVAQEQALQAAAQAEEGVVIRDIERSEAYAKKLYGEAEYDRQYQKVAERLGPEVAFRIALEKAAKGEDPAEWVYTFGKSIETPEERAASMKAEVEKAVQEALGKNKKPDPRGNEGIGRLASNNTSPAPLKDPDDMTDEELDAAIAAKRRA